MKTAFVASAAFLAVASAQSLCAVNCFQSVVTEHPPLSCKEANMYLCFCKAKDLQTYFAECAYSKCADNAQDTINFGVSLCKDLGVPIDPPSPPKTSTSAAAQTSAAEVKTSEVDTGVKSTAKQTEPAVQTTSSGALPAEITSAVATGVTTGLASLTTSIAQATSQADNKNGTQPTSTHVVVGAAVNMNAAPAVLAAAGIVAAGLHLF